MWIVYSKIKMISLYFDMSKLYQHYYQMTKTTGEKNDRSDMDNCIWKVLCSFCKQAEADYTASSSSRGINKSGNLIQVAVEVFFSVAMMGTGMFLHEFGLCPHCPLPFFLHSFSNPVLVHNLYLCQSFILVNMCHNLW